METLHFSQVTSVDNPLPTLSRHYSIILGLLIKSQREWGLPLEYTDFHDFDLNVPRAQAVLAIESEATMRRKAVEH